MAAKDEAQDHFVLITNKRIKANNQVLYLCISYLCALIVDFLSRVLLVISLVEFFPRFFLFEKFIRMRAWKFILIM